MGYCKTTSPPGCPATNHRKVSSRSGNLSRDPKFDFIVAVVPLEGGFCLVTLAKKGETSLDYKKTVLLITLERKYELKFKSAEEAKSWCSFIHMVISKQIKSKPFAMQVRNQ